MRAAPSIALAFTLCLASACEPEVAPTIERTDAEPPAPTAPPIGSWVRVNQHRLFMAPRDDARIMVDSKQPYRLAEVLELATNNFVHLRTLNVRREALCGTSSGTDPDFELQFYAPLDALRPVLNQAKVVEFDDGTKLEFEPGVPVDMSEHEARLQIGDVSFVVPVSASEIRNWFPARSKPSLGTPSPWSRDRPLYYGERSIESFKPPFVFVRARQKLEDGGELLTFVDVCGRYTLRAEPGPPVFESKPPRHGDPDMATPATDKESDPCIERLMADRAVLTWATSDRAAGWVFGSTELPATAREHEGKVCFTAVELPVCIPNEKIRQVEQYDCRVRREDSPQVELGEPSVGPGIDPTTVYRVVRAFRSDVLGCYKAGLAKQPQLAGRLVIEFEIGTDGGVESSSVVESTLGSGDETVSACVAKNAKRWDFPEPSDPVRVVFPFELSPSASVDAE